MDVTRLLLHLDRAPEETPEDTWSGIGGAVIEAAALDGALPVLAGDAVVALCGVTPEAAARWRGREGTVWVCDGGLEETARLRDAWPDLAWVPRASVYQPEVRYQFSPHLGTESFKFYIPDMGAMLARRVGDGDVDVRHWVQRAAALGFDTVWLHGRQAEERGKGLDLEALARARSRFDGAIWISGGVRETRHLENLRREGGAAAVVLTPPVLERVGGLGAALAAVRPRAGEVIAVEGAGERGGCPAAGGDAAA